MFLVLLARAVFLPGDGGVGAIEDSRKLDLLHLVTGSFSGWQIKQIPDAHCPATARASFTVLNGLNLFFFTLYNKVGRCRH